MENKTLAHRWFEEVWNKRRADAIDEMFADEGIAHGLTDASGNELRGPENFKAFFNSFSGAFSDLQVTVEETVAEGDKLAARCTVKGTHTGDGIGLAATNQPVAFTGMCMLRIKDGKIVEAWNNFDFMTMFQQLGAAPPTSYQDAEG
ncbi:MAG TPA: ester cyclase [Blastocatellia bacterium]|nr:ester cyclase [Blastocatellia bacterium]